MALSALHREQGCDPSHLLFFRRQRSQALHTRLRMLSAVDSEEEVRWGPDILETGDRGTADVEVWVARAGVRWSNGYTICGVLV